MKPPFDARGILAAAGFGLLLAAPLAAQTPATSKSAGPPHCVPVPFCLTNNGGVDGSGTPGTVPLWTGTGTTLTDSHIYDDGVGLRISLPLWAPVSTPAAPAISGDNAGTGTGVGGHSARGNGVTGVSDAATGGAGVGGFGIQTGVLGIVTGDDASWGVSGIARANGVGVSGSASTGGTGIRGSLLDCSLLPECAPTIGDAGQFVAGAGGILLHGFLSNYNRPGGWEEKFVVDAAGNMMIRGNAFKPGGGSWSTLSDRRTKTSIAPIDGALDSLLKLRGVTFEYANPSAVGELPGTHIGMVAQDVEQVFPSWVDTGDDGYKRVTYRGFEALAVEAIRELEKQNQELRQQIEALSDAMRR
jgi:hypothetical protein